MYRILGIFLFVAFAAMPMVGMAAINGAYDNQGSPFPEGDEGGIGQYADNDITPGLVSCSGLDCNACELVKTTNRVVNFFITLLTIAATIMFVMAGFKLVTSGGDTSARQSAKNMFVAILIGFIIVLSAWLLVDTVLKTLTQDDSGQGLGLEAWTTIECGGITNTKTKNDNTYNADVDSSAPGLCVGATCSGDQGDGLRGSVDTGGGLSDTAARSVLSSSGVTVWESGPGNTSLEGINTATLNEVVNLKSACNCNVVVTGGTEAGFHADGQYSHENGYKIDVDDSNDVTSYITNNYTYTGVRSDGATLYQSPGGTVYAKEGNHWDILVR